MTGWVPPVDMSLVTCHRLVTLYASHITLQQHPSTSPPHIHSRSLSTPAVSVTVRSSLRYHVVPHPSLKFAFHRSDFTVVNSSVCRRHVDLSRLVADSSPPFTYAKKTPTDLNQLHMPTRKTSRRQLSLEWRLGISGANKVWHIPKCPPASVCLSEEFSR